MPSPHLSGCWSRLLTFWSHEVSMTNDDYCYWTCWKMMKDVERWKYRVGDLSWPFIARRCCGLSNGRTDWSPAPRPSGRCTPSTAWRNHEKGMATWPLQWIEKPMNGFNEWIQRIQWIENGLESLEWLPGLKRIGIEWVEPNNLKGQHLKHQVAFIQVDATRQENLEKDSIPV